MSRAAAQATAEEPATSSPELVFRAILAGLYEGRFVPGQRLIETDLMRRFKVSRGSVREALSRLAAEGVVTLMLHRGAYIRWLTREEAYEVLAVVELLLGLAARSAAERIKAGQPPARLSEALDTLLGFAGSADLLGFVRARNRFYRAMMQIGANRELARLLPSLHVHLIRIQLRVQDTADKERFADYRRIGDAVLGGRAAAAEHATRRHVRHVRRALDRLPDDAFAPAA